MKMPWHWFRKDTPTADAAPVEEGLDPVDVLTEAAKLATPVLTEDQTDYAGIACRLGTQRKKLLDCEQAAKDEIDANIRTCSLMAFAQLYKRMDKVFLSWRNKKTGWPVFAFFSPDQSKCIFKVEKDWNGRSMREKKSFVGEHAKWNWFYFMKPTLKLPEFNDIYEKLAKSIDDEKSLDEIHLTAEFNGILPDEIRAKIHELTTTGTKAGFFDQLLIVTEAPVWELKKVIRPLNLDPLLVGIKHNEFFLIDTFDLTPAERIIASEFTYKETGTSKKT